METIITDLAAIQETASFFVGIGIAVAGAYGTMKAQGKTVYPVAKIESGKAKIKALTESNSLLGSAAEIISEISAEELSAMLAKKKELDATPGITNDQKIVTLGQMFVNAMEKQ